MKIFFALLLLAMLTGCGSVESDFTETEVREDAIPVTAEINDIEVTEEISNEDEISAEETLDETIFEEESISEENIFEEEETTEIFDEEILEIIEEMTGEEEIISLEFESVDLSLLSTGAIERILDALIIPQGQAGAFDIDVAFETGNADGVILSLEMNIKLISDGRRVEVLTTTTGDLGFMGMIEFGFYTLHEDGQHADSRVFFSGVEMRQETLATLGIDEIHMPGGMKLEEIIFEALRQTLEIPVDFYDNFEITVSEAPLEIILYSENWNADIELPGVLAEIGQGNFSFDTILISTSFDMVENPDRLIIELNSEDGTFTVVRVYFNPGDVVINV